MERSDYRITNFYIPTVTNWFQTNHRESSDQSQRLSNIIDDSLRNSKSLPIEIIDGAAYNEK